MKFIIVLMTTSNKQEATNIVQTLLKEGIIACGNIIENVSSIFWWKNKIEKEKEALVIMKSEQSLFNKISEKIRELHSYDIPEILALPIIDASQSYSDWMRENLNRCMLNGQKAN